VMSLGFLTPCLTTIHSGEPCSIISTSEVT
jgi:hypothetical protein